MTYFFGITNKKNPIFNCLRSHPVGLDGRNHIVAVMPMEFLPSKEFKKRQKSINPNFELALMSSWMKRRNDVIGNKNRAKAGFPFHILLSKSEMISMKNFRKSYLGVEDKRKRRLLQEEK